MADRHTNEWRTQEIQDLLEAILSLRDLDEAERFFRDLCTLGELEAMAHRWAVAKLLDGNGLPYHEIARRTGASTATVTRVAHWLRHGEDGYRLALDRRRRKTRRARTG
jgi:TrpR-related protein YerC/YecD